MQVLLRRLERYARSCIRRFGILALGGVLLAIGVGFLLAALWMVLAAQFSPLAATFIYAALFLGAGLVILYAVSRQDAPKPPSPKQEQRSETGGRSISDKDQSLLDAFLFGADLYARLRERTPPPDDRRNRR